MDFGHKLAYLNALGSKQQPFAFIMVVGGWLAVAAGTHT